MTVLLGFIPKQRKGQIDRRSKFCNNFTGSLYLNESSSSWCSLFTKHLTARLPTTSLNYFKLALRQGIFDLALYHKIQLSSQNKSYVTGFQEIIFLCLFKLLFCCWFYCALNRQEGWYVSIYKSLLLLILKRMTIDRICGTVEKATAMDGLL